ncbi:MAG: efflux RND transporter periplasmic adaptor subunit [Paracoccaceae bacterium]|nr:efflux RND transporter periplasmic adaptor subunit [Paracoccaceae bacterium]
MAAAEIETATPPAKGPQEQAVTTTPLVPALRHDAPARASRGRRWWPWLMPGVMAIALGVLAYTQVWMTRPVPVATETAALAPVTRVLAVNGRIAAVHAVDIRAAVTGTLSALPVAEGQSVATDQILAQVDAAAQNAALRQAMAGLDSALVAQQRAQEAYDRAAALGGTVARTVRDSAALDLQAATQEVARLRAVLDQADILLQNHTIRAPFAGTVLELDADLGQIVGPTVPLLRLADLGDLVVEADVDEAYATQIALNQPAVLQLAGETQRRDGHVSFVSTRVDETTGGLTIRIAFDAAVTAPIGLTVATNIIVDRQDAALTIPRTAMLTGANGTAVFVVRDGVAQRQPVTVVDWPAARLIVTEGITAGDVIISDAEGTEDGQAVAVDQP